MILCITQSGTAITYVPECIENGEQRKNDSRKVLIF